MKISAINNRIFEDIKQKYLQGEEEGKKYMGYWYRNIEGVRNSGINYVMSHDELIEYVKCSTDIIYFIENYCKVPTVNGIKQIKLRDYQKQMIKHFLENRFSIYFMSRQLGLSTILLLIQIHSLIFGKDIHIAMLDIKNDEYERFDAIFRSIPFFLKSGADEYNRNNVKFENGNWIKFENSSIKVLDKDTNHLILQNLAYYTENQMMRIKTFMVKIMEVANSRLIIAGIMNGYNFFTELVQNSERMDGDPQKNIFKTFRAYWWMVPGRDEHWKNREISNLGKDEFDNQYDLKIIVS